MLKIYFIYKYFYEHTNIFAWKEHLASPETRYFIEREKIASNYLKIVLQIEAYIIYSGPKFTLTNVADFEQFLWRVSTIGDWQGGVGWFAQAEEYSERRVPAVHAEGLPGLWPAHRGQPGGDGGGAGGGGGGAAQEEQQAPLIR